MSKHEENTAFVWGAASAAFQIEGAYLEDGKGLSIWDVYTHEPGKTKCGDTGDVTCDHYHRYKEDVQLMARLGITAYRFSIAWSRVLPQGTGAENPAGIAFYHGLIDALLQNGIQPYVTLYHWDLPQALFEKGGWLSPDMPDWFAEYARLVGREYGGKVKNFITINEPSNVIEGMSPSPAGTNAPGLGYTLRDRLTAVHTILKAHGRAVTALRQTVPDAKIGFAPCSSVPCPVDETHIEDARQAYFAFEKGDLHGTGSLRLFYDPIFLGDYPPEYYEYYADILPHITREDLASISQPIDYCFQNIYSGGACGAADAVPCECNMLGWPVRPETLYWGCRFLYERYHHPIMLTENGYPAPDIVSGDGRVHDPNRIEFIRRYTGEMLRARADGVDVRGYFYWTIMDNLEWELGFGPRFGLIHVDFDTLQRTPKDSYYFYQQLIQQHSANDKEEYL